MDSSEYSESIKHNDVDKFLPKIIIHLKTSHTKFYKSKQKLK